MFCDSFIVCEIIHKFIKTILFLCQNFFEMSDLLDQKLIEIVFGFYVLLLWNKKLVHFILFRKTIFLAAYFLSIYSWVMFSSSELFYCQIDFSFFIIFFKLIILRLNLFALFHCLLLCFYILPLLHYSF